MLNLVRKIFARKEQQRLSIPLSELKQWFDVESEKHAHCMESAFQEFRQMASLGIERAYSRVAALEKAELRNPKIPPKAISLMQGNRQSYIKAATFFLNNIRLPEAYTSFQVFHHNYMISLSGLEKSTARSYIILQEFFANEASDIAISIKDVSVLIKDFNSHLESIGILKLDSIKGSIKNIHAVVKEESENQTMLQKLNEGLLHQKKLIGTLNEELENLKKSPEYCDFLNILESEKDIQKFIGITRDKIHQPFSVLQKALKKYSKISLQHEKLIDSYVNDPIKALQSDEGLAIINILSGLKASISALGLDDKKKARSINEINALTLEYITSFLKSYEELNDNLTETREKISSNSASQEHKRIQGQLEKAASQVAGISSQKAKLVAESGKINIEKQKDLLEKEIKEALKRDISIVC